MNGGRPIRELGKGGVQSYLMELVEAAGGMPEHFATPGKVGPPDLIITWPYANIHFAETKTKDGKLEPWQIRDHERRRKLGCIVVVIWTKDQAEFYVHAMPHEHVNPHMWRRAMDKLKGAQ